MSEHDDPCRYCSRQGNTKECETTICKYRENWYVKQLRAELEAAQKEIAILNQMVFKLGESMDVEYGNAPGYWIEYYRAKAGREQE